MKAFRAQYKNKKTADALLSYMRGCWDECRNSNPPAVGFEKRVWQTCCHWDCNRAGKCSLGMPFKMDWWNKPAKVAAMLPKDKLNLLLELDKGVSVKDAYTKVVEKMDPAIQLH